MTDSSVSFCSACPPRFCDLNDAVDLVLVSQCLGVEDCDVASLTRSRAVVYKLPGLPSFLFSEW